MASKKQPRETVKSVLLEMAEALQVRADERNTTEEIKRRCLEQARDMAACTAPIESVWDGSRIPNVRRWVDLVIAETHKIVEEREPFPRFKGRRECFRELLHIVLQQGGTANPGSTRVAQWAWERSGPPAPRPPVDYCPVCGLLDDDCSCCIPFVATPAEAIADEVRRAAELVRNPPDGDRIGATLDWIEAKRKQANDTSQAETEAARPRRPAEFYLLWFESRQRWVAVTSYGQTLDGGDKPFASEGMALAAFLEATQTGVGEYQRSDETAAHLYDHEKWRAAWLAAGWEGVTWNG